MNLFAICCESSASDQTIVPNESLTKILLRGTPVFDAVPFYPAWLYKDPGAPLHILQQLRDFYVSEYNDPIVQEDKQPHYMGIFFAIEIAMQLPMAFYSVYRLSGKKVTSGRFELALLVYALETALSSVLCLHFVYLQDPVEYPKKDITILQGYVPWVVARKFLPSTLAFVQLLMLHTASLLFVDMFYRLYSRLATTDAVKKNQ